MIKADYFTCKKNRTTFILSILVFIIHMPSLANYTLEGSFGNAVYIGSELLTLFSRVAVPLFLIMSGALFYRNYELNKTKEKYKSRFKSLVVPYLVWNIIWVVFNLICSYTSISKFFINRQLFTLSAGNILGGIFLYKAYAPFWFIFDLIIFTLICPFLYFAVKNKKVGICVLAALIILNMFGIGLPESVFFRYDALTYYFAGALLGRHGFDLFKRKSTLGQRILAICVFAAGYVYLFLENNKILPSILYVPVLLCMCFAFWVIMDFFVGDGYFGFETASFLIFATHMNVGTIFAKLLYIAMPKSMYFAPINYILTLVLSTAVICLFDALLKKLPRLRNILTGARK